jgi:hypothetical protein
MYQNSLWGEVLNKFDIHFVRLALIMQIMDDYKTNQISLSAVRATARLCEYFIESAKRILNIIEKPAIADVLPDDKQKFYNDLPAAFTTSQALELGYALGFRETAINTFIARKDLFIWKSHGNYTKK